ncbi:MAG: DUF2784 domain-containing protein [Rhodoferax sp.]|nr:DUF2784 domain-containing protein [Rhodoferax sp.]
MEFSGGICPLTPLENRLRWRAGDDGYHSGFIAHYLIPIIYPEGLTRDWQMVLGVAGHCGRRQSGVSAQFSPAPRKTRHHFQPEARKTLAGWRFASLRHKRSHRTTPEVLVYQPIR